MSDEGRLLFDEELLAKRKLRRLAAAAAVGVLLLQFFKLGQTVDLKLYDAWFAVRGPRAPSPQVVVVGFDEKAITHYGPYPWPRDTYAPLIDKLSAAGARVIGFDVTFLPVAREAENNAVLAASIEKAGNVVFGFELDHVGNSSPPGREAPAEIAANALTGGTPGFDILPAPELIPTEPVLAAAAAALGTVNSIPEVDDSIRNQQVLLRHGKLTLPSLGLQMARIYAGITDDIAVVDGKLRAGYNDLPISAIGELPIDWTSTDWSRDQPPFPVYSIVDVVRGDIAESEFAGKAVLLAGTAKGMDDRNYPFVKPAPGVFTHATFLDNFFNGNFITRPGWAGLAELAAVVLLGLLAVAVYPRLSTKALFPLAAVLLLAILGAAFAAFMSGMWIRALYPAAAVVLPFLAVVIVKLGQKEEEVRDVTAGKRDADINLALSFQEKGLLDMSLAQLNKLPMSEDLKPLYISLGLDFANKGFGEKAFIAYKKVFDVDPGYENIAVRMENLRRAGYGTQLFDTAGATAGMAPTAGMAAPPAEMPLATVPAGSVEDPTMASEPDTQALEIDSAEATAALDATEVLGETGAIAPAEMQTEPENVATAGGATAGSATAAGAGAKETKVGAGTGTGGTVSGATAAGAPPPAAAPVPGAGPGITRRFGRYEVLKKLGRGAMGDVFLVRDPQIGRTAAMKTIRVDAELSQKQLIEMRQRFYREAQTAGALTHPNIVTIYDLGEEQGVSFIVMEFVEGQTLTQMTKKGRLTPAQVKHVIIHAALGLDYAHQNGVFHRDVKPDNIMISKTGVVKMMDFGIARIVDSEMTATGTVLGTPYYMSPEQFSGKKVDARSDIFSLGVVLYELLVGKRPFTGSTPTNVLFSILKHDPPPPSQTDAKVDPKWDPVLAQALAKDPTQRFENARALATAVRDL